MNPSPASPTLALRDLHVRFGAVRALAGLSAEIPPGAVGLLGPNGAGKTTLIKVLLGLLSPDAGGVLVGGLDPARRSERLELRRRVGFMPESDCLMPRRTGIELVATLGRLTGLVATDAMTRAHEVLDYVQLEDQRYRPIDGYSTGMKQRLKLAQALVHDPPLLLLDEPTNGLDPRGRRHMLELVHDLGHAHGKSVLVCSHLLPDVEKTCDHVVVLHRGRAVAQGGIAELTGGEGRLVNVRVQGDGAPGFERGLESEGISAESIAPGAYRVDLCPNGSAPRSADFLFRLAADAGLCVEAVEPVRSTLEEVFLGALEDADGERAGGGSA